MKNKLWIALAASGAMVAGAGVAEASAPVDVSVSVASRTAVPGGATVGSWAIVNAIQGEMPAGATYLVKFERMQGGSITGTTTVTSTEVSRVRVQKLSQDSYRVTLTQPLNPGQQVTGLWSDAHWFNIGQRDRVSISSENIPAGAVDTNAANDTATYDNSGQGF